MNREEARREIERLSGLLKKYQHSYYVLARNEASDAEYDRLFDELLGLEQMYPDLLLPDSPTQRVGSDLSLDFPEISHSIPVLSLDKTYTVAELNAWTAKLREKAGRDLSFVAEEKIDGVSIVLYYREGLLRQAVTRGNGFVGNDVTANVKTIGAVPLSLPEPLDVAVRGEIFLPLKEFDIINTSLEVPYVNPRNLASGTLRRVKSSEVARVPLDIFTYEGFFARPMESHDAILKRLGDLGFKINPATTLFRTNDSEGFPTHGDTPFRVARIDELEEFIREETTGRASLPYEIDGIVLKVNELPVRENLGYTGHHPRWAVAYKFEAPLGETRLLEIDVQVGRTGRITPVARVEPVAVGGATIRNVTLHNADYITQLEAAPGDMVAVSRRGDVIPAVEKVTEKGPENTWSMPESCPSCGSPLSRSGAHHFCTNRACPAQVRGRILFFADRGQMDIEGLGAETIDVLLEHRLIKDLEDLFTFDYSKLLDLPGFGEKKVELIRRGIEICKTRPYQTVLKSLGIPDLGTRAAELLVGGGFTSIDSLIALADGKNTAPLEEIGGIGEKTARGILQEFRKPELRRQIEALRRAGLRLEAEATEEPSGPPIFAGQTWCVTGSFEHFKPRERAMDEVTRRGGRTTGQVSGQTTHLLAGEGAGSKLEKALQLGITIVSEKEFLAKLEGDRT